MGSPAKEMTHDELKDEIRAAYVFKRRRKQPGYRGGEDLEKVLHGAADNCVQLKMEPKDYMDALYLEYGVRQDKFWPAVIGGKAGLEVARKYAANFKEPDFDVLWKTQLQVLKHAVIHTKRDVINILADPELPFAPWFRVITTVEPVEKILRAYGQTAKERLSPKLKKSITEIAPAQVDRIVNYERYLPSA